MCQVETSESLEGIFSGGLINRGKNHLKRFDSLYKLNHRSFLEPDINNYILYYLQSKQVKRFSHECQVVGEI